MFGMFRAAPLRNPRIFRRQFSKPQKVVKVVTEEEVAQELSLKRASSVDWDGFRMALNGSLHASISFHPSL